MKSLEIGMVKKYHKIYVFKLAKQNLSQDVKRGDWRFFIDTVSRKRTRVHTPHTIESIYWALGIVWDIEPSICDNGIIFYLPINWFAYFITLHFDYLCRVCLCVIWKQQIDHRIEYSEKTNSQMIAVETEANIVDCLCEFCRSIPSESKKHSVIRAMHSVHNAFRHLFHAGLKSQFNGMQLILYL